MRWYEVLIIPIAYREGGPPAATVDLITNSLPRLVLRTLMQGIIRHAENLDRFACPVSILSAACLTIPRELLDGLAARGFKHYRGEHDAGLYWISLVKKGAFYIGTVLNDYGARDPLIRSKTSVPAK